MKCEYLKAYNIDNCEECINYSLCHENENTISYDNELFDSTDM